MSERLEADLAMLDRETTCLLVTASGLTDTDLRRPSLCDGWTRAHVLTHLARNADALLNLVHWAADGRPREAYASEQQRAADIEAGVGRNTEEVLRDVRESAERFRAGAEVLRGPAGAAEVHTRAGTTVTGAQVVAMRLLEVVLHHVDLDAGFSLDQTDPAWVQRTLRRGIRRWQSSDHPPALTIRPDGMDPSEIGGGGPSVEGSPSALLLWLARGVRNGLRSDGDLPAPPPWS